MAKINLTASAYRVERGKAEIAREAKWQKTAKLATKKRLELKKPKPAEEGNKGIGPKAPDNNEPLGDGEAMGDPETQRRTGSL